MVFAMLRPRAFGRRSGHQPIAAVGRKAQRADPERIYLAHRAALMAKLMQTRTLDRPDAERLIAGWEAAAEAKALDRFAPSFGEPAEGGSQRAGSPNGAGKHSSSFRSLMVGQGIVGGQVARPRLVHAVTLPRHPSRPHDDQLNFTRHGRVAGVCCPSDLEPAGGPSSPPETTDVHGLGGRSVNTLAQFAAPSRVAGGQSGSSPS